MRTVKIEIWQGKRDRLWYAHIRGGNGKIVWQTEGYCQKAGAMKAVKLAVNIVYFKAYVNGNQIPSSEFRKY